MEIEYEIVDFNELTGQVTIKTKGKGEKIVVDLPIDDNGNVPAGIDLVTHINGFIPAADEVRAARLINGINNTSQIKELVKPEPPVEQVEDTSEQIKFRTKVLAILREEGLLK